ncbi:DNA alkylation repair protein [Streptococcus merionis]|uniref:DNA alkylation repair protein n=1 Tax=Streptococcus merionis TaxID=400065 RepID=UPI0026E9944D|nr:DNA alkylation repair protein [Streptococcus merionis]
MKTQKSCEILLSRFENTSNPTKAQSMSAYMRHQFDFYGIPTPERRRIYKDIISKAKESEMIDWDLLDFMWNQPKRECHYFVCDYLVAVTAHLTIIDLPKLMYFAQTQQWWDTIDHLDYVFGHIADEKMPEILLAMSLSDDFWLRRIAIDHQLGKKEQTDTELLQNIILNNLGSQEFFINKAIGWSLRDYSKTNPDWVRNFIDQHHEKMAPLSIREASKYL